MILADVHPAARWFWGLLLAGCLIWYGTVTVYVAIRGLLDIRTMLRRLEEVRRSGPA